jgi:hypothetical protein
MSKKLNIIYRCCENETSKPFRDIRPIWFDKLNCLKTFILSVEKNLDLIDNLIFLHDGPYGKLFEQIPKKYEIQKISSNNNEDSLLKTFEIADSLSGDIYFVEDDYLHLINSIFTIYHGIKNFGLVTGYDHLDRYTRSDDITRGKEYIAFSKKTNCHWRTSESTCCTWACSRELWNSDIREIAYKFKLNDRDFFRYLFNEKNIRLWNPIPAVTTQVDINLSPCINWSIL